jgi:hypothetical protein
VSSTLTRERIDALQRFERRLAEHFGEEPRESHNHYLDLLFTRWAEPSGKRDPRDIDRDAFWALSEARRKRIVAEDARRQLTRELTNARTLAMIHGVPFEEPT